MNENKTNLEFLKDGIKYMGFSENAIPVLEQSVSQGVPEFQILLETVLGKDQMAYTLHFKKGTQNDMYFFNKYDARLTPVEGEKRSHTFYVDRNKGVTAKEAYNLLSGRAVNKDLTNQQGQKYNAWLQLDFNGKDQHGNYLVKKFSEGYGYSLEVALEKLPLDLKFQEKDFLIKSLKRGNLHEVNLRDGGKHFISACPQYKNLNLYDANGKVVKPFTGQAATATAQGITPQQSSVAVTPKDTVDPQAAFDLERALLKLYVSGMDKAPYKDDLVQDLLQGKDREVSLIMGDTPLPTVLRYGGGVIELVDPENKSSVLMKYKMADLVFPEPVKNLGSPGAGNENGKHDFEGTSQDGPSGSEGDYNPNSINSLVDEFRDAENERRKGPRAGEQKHAGEVEVIGAAIAPTGESSKKKSSVNKNDPETGRKRTIKKGAKKTGVKL